MQYKVAIRFAIQGDLRFLSHHDTMRLFVRALARTGMPVTYSKGFNPHPKISLPLPRSVGMASEADVILIELESLIDPEEARQLLASEMVEGLTLTDAWTMESNRPPQPDRVTYELTLPDDRWRDFCEPLERILAAEQWTVERDGIGKQKAKTIDVKDFITEASLTNTALRWTHRVLASGSLRPAEWLKALGLDPLDYGHRVIRKDVQWTGMDSAPTSEHVNGDLLQSDPP